MPQPLPSRLHHTEIHLAGYDCSPSKTRPALALLAMSVIAEWSILDSMLNALFVKLLGSSAPIGAAIYGSLTGGAAQRSALSAVAGARLTDEEYKVFNAIALITKTLRTERNTIAHGIWGYAVELENGVLLIDPVDALNFDVAMVDLAATKINFNPTTFPMDKIQVFYEVDFKNLSDRIGKLMSYVPEFMRIVSENPGSPLDGQELIRLAQAPEIAEALSRLQRRNNPTEPAQ